MQVIVRNQASRTINGIMFLFLLGLGTGLVFFAGGFLGWLFCGMFVLFSLMPLDSLIRPETNLLAIDHGMLIWHNTKQGKRIDEGSIPLNQIRKIKRYKTSGFKKQSVGDLHLEAEDKKTYELPMYLHLSVHETAIIKALQNANSAIVIEDGGEVPSMTFETKRGQPMNFRICCFFFFHVSSAPS